ncbi:MAG: metal-dependent transcriptional regulator [Clostridia bacterium]|nr:metal-dependent transcriptional regulator [Clostridia bacterium]
MYESGENYLETILILQNRQASVRSVDVANELGYSKPSISRAMGILRRNGYVTIGSDGALLLTELGRAMAESIYERHQCIAAFLQKSLGISRETADADACRIEHVISEETFEAIKRRSAQL